jgi:hypothetical protein
VLTIKPALAAVVFPALLLSFLTLHSGQVGNSLLAQVAFQVEGLFVKCEYKAQKIGRAMGIETEQTTEMKVK